MRGDRGDARASPRGLTALPVGFHGHDNLGLAIANSLEMVRQGAGFVDTSLQGLGRSAGNAPTELMAAALARMGCETGIDFLGALRLGYKYVQPLMRARGRMPLDVVAGFAGFHSSFMPNVLKVASRRRVDAAQLIIAMCQLDKVHADEAGQARCRDGSRAGHVPRRLRLQSVRRPGGEQPQGV